jgi:hypothetical protein
MAAKKITIRGSITISLVKNDLEAALEFRPGPETREMDSGDLVKFLQEKGVKEGFSPQDLERILKQLEKAGEPLTLPVAMGIPPENPIPEKPIWQPMPIPDHMRADADRAFSGAGAPVISTEKVEKIKTEKIVVKKSSIPFMAPKEEKVTVLEKKITQERIYVDAHVEGKGYVTEGMKIALYEPMTPGIPGKAVTGIMIPAENPADPYVYAGKGVEKKRGELVAASTGFIRWGKNWAEIIGFNAHEWEVTLTPEKATCLLSLTPGDKSARRPTIEEVLQKTEELKYPGDLLLPPDEIDRMIGDIIAAGTPVKNIALSVRREPYFEIKVSEDKLKAVITIRKGRGGGSTLSLKEIGTAIKTSGIKNLDFEKIKTDIMAFYRSDAGDLEGYPLAEGKAALPGPDRTMECSVRFLERKVVEEMKKAAADRPEGTQDLASAMAFPPEAAELIGAVEREQRVLALGPEVPGQPGVDVYGNVIPGPPGRETGIIVRENLERKQNVVISLIKGLYEQRKTDGGLEIRVRPHANAEIKVALAPNRMEAYLTLFPSEGTGAPVSMDMIREEIKKAGILRGIREEVLEAAFERVSNGETLTDIPFALGQAPEEGSTDRIKFLVQIASGSAVVIRGDGSADFKNRDTITAIDEGTALAEILPPEKKPQNGWDVTGKEIPAKNTPTLELEIGPNIRQEKKEDKTLLIAAKSGELLYDKKKIDIQDAHVIKGNVDLSTGNVKFPGSVTVSGSVASGFFVLSGGDIKIGEGIEAALLSADGSILIQQGIKGAGKAVLRSKKNILTSFAEGAVMLSVGDIKIKNGCMRCMVKCNGKLQFLTEKGTIIGGVVKARHGIETASLGSERGVRTEISFGQDYLVADQIDLEDKEIKKLSAAAVKLDIQMRECEKNGERQKLEILRTEKLKNLKIMEKRSLRLFTLREKFEEHYPGEIIVRGTLHPGVVIESHGRYHEITAPKKGLRITFNSETGRIQEEPLDKGGK